MITEYACDFSGGECETVTENNWVFDEPHIIVAEKGLKMDL
jgi:hypothetical protein